MNEEAWGPWQQHDGNCCPGVIGEELMAKAAAGFVSTGVISYMNTVPVCFLPGGILSVSAFFWEAMQVHYPDRYENRIVAYRKRVTRAGKDIARSVETLNPELIEA